MLARRRWRRSRERHELSWAALTSRRILAAGTTRGAPRRPGETLVEYGDRLAADILPDDRLGPVVRLVSAGLFSRHPTPTDHQAWADDVLDQVERANPAREVRRRRRATARPDTGSGAPTPATPERRLEDQTVAGPAASGDPSAR